MNMSLMNPMLELVMYGVWIPGKGWLKVTNDAGFTDYYSDNKRQIVEDTATRFHGEVRYIDHSLAMLEAQILQQEKDDRTVAELTRITGEYKALADDLNEENTLWHTLRNFWLRVSRR